MSIQTVYESICRAVGIPKNLKLITDKDCNHFSKSKRNVRIFFSCPFAIFLENLE